MNIFKTLLGFLSYLMTLWEIKKAICGFVKALINQRLVKIKSYFVNILKSLLHFLSHLTTLEAIKKQLASLLTW